MVILGTSKIRYQESLTILQKLTAHRLAYRSGLMEVIILLHLLHIPLVEICRQGEHKILGIHRKAPYLLEKG